MKQDNKKMKKDQRIKIKNVLKSESLKSMTLIVKTSQKNWMRSVSSRVRSSLSKTGSANYKTDK